MKWKIHFILLIFLFSCSGNSDKHLIPDRDMVKILTEIHKADAMVNLPMIRKRFGSVDSLTYSDYILKKYHYSRELFDSTLAELSGNPAKFDKIYERVLRNLNQEEGRLNEIEEKALLPTEGIDLWDRKRNWSFPADGSREMIEFDLPLKGVGTYTLFFRAKLYNDDGSMNPRAMVWFWYDNGTPNGLRKMFPVKHFLRTEKWENYTISAELTDTLFTHIRGYIIHSDPVPGEWSKHCEIQDIKLLFKPSSPTNKTQ
ncbi:MAG TPA: DUF4296 domain-containing protein [Bacteroidales bacterium]|nr:DUF4296 domain-containing protein [Bacteroidales bacterium]HQH41881.1 DUF4296 domain-containing protein [Bacteroidales bacterium]HQK38332.1 DUF4296 domain-containing protein [Bacteroidales bacterium]